MNTKYVSRLTVFGENDSTYNFEFVRTCTTHIRSTQRIHETGDNFKCRL